jgi:hypothetical protein
MTQETNNMKFICLDCFTVGELTAEARCVVCNSGNVISTELVKQASVEVQGTTSSKPQQIPGVWYHIRYDVFETIVSPAKASNLDEAHRYAMSPLCEWYLHSDSLLYPGFDTLELESKTLNHKEYLEWCEAKWPLGN